MNNYNKTIIEELSRFKRKSIDQKTRDRFLEKIKSTEKLTKNVNSDEHICSFFIPYNRQTGTVYIGHHIKANSWIPPGGHINELEHPVETVVREFFEELGTNIDKSQVSTLSLSIKDISDNPRNPCKVHYDLWYVVDVPRIDFAFIKREYYDARWMTIDEAMKVMNIPLYKKIVRSVKDTL
jgi:8-oxo-dGTP pyrophosphatase MutT (NUDIX family)